MFTMFLDQIADAYRDAPDYSHTRPGRDAWDALGDDAEDRAAGIRLLLDVIETDDAEPYNDAVEMCEDIHSGRLLVSRANSEHPIWDKGRNIDFRIVHDVLGHYAASIERGFLYNPLRPDSVAGFDWAGENLACQKHFALLRSVDARMALFSECLMQTAYMIQHGSDGHVQKCVFGEQAIFDLLPNSTQLMSKYRRVVLMGAQV